MAANYNNSAWFYDKLSRIVYSRALINAQVYLLQYVPPNASILIAGGGTGWILEELARLHSSGLQITYVEVAADMMIRSQKRNAGNNKVIFINDAVENITPGTNFDVAITPFLFDNFTEKTTLRVFNHIHGLLKPGGLWLNTDFQLTGKWWQSILLKLMLLFFKLLCKIEASQLPDVESLFKQHGYKAVKERTFFGDFIISKAYKQI